MDVLDEIMAPFQWLVSVIMVGIHDGLSAAGMPAASGWTWTLSIIGLVLLIRAALIPVFLKQLDAQRRMRLLQPDLKKLQEKYQGKTDPLSRQAMAQEQMALYREHGTNPFSACLPVLVQVPFFLGLFQVLSGISTRARQGEGIGAMSAGHVVQFDQSSIFGASLTASVLHGGAGDPAAVALLTVLMILVMVAAQFLTQRRIMARTAVPGAPESPLVKQQKMLLYALPVVFAVGGVLFPIGVLVYWTVTNLWTMVQQFLVSDRQAGQNGAHG
ncbi:MULTISPECIES: membrane protein insertase YidC [unclassified Arthrobacter]|uniref:membrane protein insertase YidC n=1 Tax=unclassified Arthrobacter TaxID=235627 RepID=UPI0009A7480C|nr:MULTISPECIES: membrane protein insertase YidC [unclassified Arthrobacter]RDV09833.1 membrane protein insertase YidC [Arthrobacter sp. RT-1]SLK01005.1 YidC/Oxa1 family membrane protein insertase [Arthrobacter sp. P2b]